MANRSFSQGKGYLEKGVCHVFCAIVLGTSGAVTATGSGGKGVASVVKTAGKVGRYTITLQDRYMSVLSARVTFIGTTDAAAGGSSAGYFRNNNLATATKTIDVQLASAGTDAEADNNTVVLIELVLKDSVI
jgi:hypothetical protein